MIMGKRKGLKMPKNFQKIQEDLMSKMQNDIKDVSAEGTAAGDMVKVKLDGNFNITELNIAPDLVDPDDVEFLEDSLKAAFNNAVNNLNEQMSQKMSFNPADMLKNFNL
jgi:nucleoid-associated protein EbfC